MLTFPLQSRFSFEIVDCVNVGEARMAEWEAKMGWSVCKECTFEIRMTKAAP